MAGKTIGELNGRWAFLAKVFFAINLPFVVYMGLTMNRMSQEMAILTARVAELPPALLVYRIEVLEDVVKSIGAIEAELVRVRTDDRWRKLDDEMYMREFSKMNGLELPPHERITE